MNSKNDENRRTRYRVRLPVDSMLKAYICGQCYDVFEVAELSIVVTSKFVLNEDGVCHGHIVWSDGRKKQFIGELGRLNIHGRVIWNIKGFTTQDIVKEQRWLLKRFPAVKGQSRFVQPEIFNPEND